MPGLFLPPCQHVYNYALDVKGQKITVCSVINDQKDIKKKDKDILTRTKNI